MSVPVFLQIWIARLRHWVRLQLGVVEVMKEDVQALRVEVESLRRSTDRALVALDPAALRNFLRPLVVAETTACAIPIFVREASYRFDKEFGRRMSAEVDQQLPSVIERLALVPLPDVTAAVTREIDAIVAARLSTIVSALFGGGTIHVSARAAE